jgi:anti-sigma-K factor RskA
MNDPHQLLAGYALDALSADDRAAFEAHLQTCDDCQRELAEFGTTVAELSVISQNTPPPQLRDDVLSAIGQVRQADPDPLTDQTGTDAPPGSPGVQDSGGPRHGVAPAPEPAVPLARARARRRRIARTVTAVVGAAALVAVIALGGWAYARNQLTETYQADAIAISRVLAAPDARIYHQTAPDGMRVTYVVSEERNAGMAVPENVSDPGEGRTYQLWTVTGGQSFVPDRTFDSAGGPILLTGDVAAAAALGVTVEPDGGSPQPTTEPFAVQSL